MFYVEKWRRDKKKDLRMLHIGPPIIVFLAFVGITIWSWTDARQNIEATRNAILDSHIKETRTNIEGRLSTYEDILRAGGGLFGSSTDVTRTEWQDFIRKFELDKRYPGVLGIGYAELIPPESLNEHIEKVRASGVPDYRVFPEGNRGIYSSIVYLEPQSPDNAKAIGFDMYSNPVRKKTMDLAISSGSTAITPAVKLVQDGNNPNNPMGFLLYTPLYKKGTPHSNPAERAQNIQGFIYAPFRSTEFLKESSKAVNDENYGFRVYSGDSNKGTLLYESPLYSKVDKTKNKNTSSQTFSLLNETWTISASISPEIVSSSERNRPFTILWGGTLLSIMIAVFIYFLLLNRTRVLRSKEDREIQEAKDELLALASHQLRTPATGVKQYLGLLKEGYAGSLNKDQRLYINKAYESNERQLNTINEMLFVARSDAGNIKLIVKELEIKGLLTDILDEQVKSFRDKHQRLNRNLPDKKIYIYGDEQYLRMAFENVISNACKYTPEYGTISVTLRESNDQIEILVKDTGVGVEEKDYNMLFRKFSRIPNELTSKVSGSGIGLYLTKAIVKAHRGKISFNSTPNIGSIVAIILPVNVKKTK